MMHTVFGFHFISVLSTYCFYVFICHETYTEKAINLAYIGTATPDAVWRLLFLIYRVTASLSSSDWDLSHPRCVSCIAVMCGSNYVCIT